MSLEMNTNPFRPEPIILKLLATQDDLEELEVKDAIYRLEFIGDTITLMRHKLKGKVPLVGFTHAPVN